ncbi:hypothetical protein RHO13_01745 [Orbus wheelerorum]|uniref:hypothetical protein n=1 Tax=Orbus wheelerorum TaxID=3074111 RepID=UPI00370DD131
MNIKLLINQINETKYWDMPILDLQSKYFGDEIYLFIEKNNKVCWKISFISCYKVSYETDANWRGDFQVKNMTNGQLGYYGQDISLSECDDNKDFISASLDLSIMTMKIVCKTILVEEIEMQYETLFYRE